MFIMIKEYKKAMDVFNKLLAIYRGKGMGSSTEAADALADIAQIFLYQEKFDESIEQMKASIDIRLALDKQQNGPCLLAQHYGNIGTICIGKNLIDAAIKYSEMAFQVYKEQMGPNSFQAQNFYKQIEIIREMQKQMRP